MPAVAQAASNGDYGAVLRTARVAAGLNLEEAAALAGFSPSTLSRMETKRNRHWDVRELRRLAEVFAIPAHLFGLSRSTFDTGADSLSTGVDEDGDPMRRRDLIATTTAVVTGALVLPLDQAAAAPGMADTVEDVLFGRVSVAPIPGNQLAAQLAAARADFRATRYTQLARRLPRLLAQAIAGREAAAVDEVPLAAGRLAQAYNVATQLLIKLHDNGMAWATADRAAQAARGGDDPMVLAEARRLAATVMRRTKHRDGAQKLMLDAARSLQADTSLPDAAHSALYGQLLAAASYTAAVRDDRETAWALLGEAEDAARRVGGTKADRFNMLELAVYKISVSRVLGDYGSAVDYARLVDPARIVSPERRARYWEDTALALHGRGRPRATFQALLAAERDTPQEVRFRPWAQQLTTDLLARSHSLPGVREFASRVGVA
ncbi:helix-turn-helix transcriptional regulator [Micromonospora sp. WMMD1102]|uniref:helix-turn-helix domain-containing protein n=1 Tax=Micromonospora sp. WMMD1102 TaxID=3016105 RepID=UPI0024150BA5|nr:helix-turn-helix transcriptional regulator [Micromonospora sp. WMMD1102]MDG4791112.1 helix-turn-helix transcriptional regulator [Micromonospora sp. WMMD1102]